MTYWVYILTNWNNRILYTGVTNDVKRRLYEHKQPSGNGFHKRYNVHKLVYKEAFSDKAAAVARELAIKNWPHEKKRALIESVNPRWEELSL